MTNQEIKKRCENLSYIISEAQERLRTIRDKECKHESTSKGFYSWRVGSTQEAMICDYCGKPTELIPYSQKFNNETTKS
jgi:hypothetical protein